MRSAVLLLGCFFPVFASADLISVSVPLAVTKTVDNYRAECTDEGGELELDGDEVYKLRTDEGEAAYVIHAMFTCGDLGHLWCGAMGCPAQIVLNDVVYETDRILQRPPNRISSNEDGSLTYWTPDGFEFNVQP
ncbi:hypothetical protein OAR42_04175 [Planktomarina temperata]|nr:hypothetical protein [Planktomarina temperata]